MGRKGGFVPPYFMCMFWYFVFREGIFGVILRVDFEILGSCWSILVY